MAEIPKRTPYKGLWISIQHRFGPRRLEWSMGILMCTVGLAIYGTGSFSRPAWVSFGKVFSSEAHLAMIMIFLGLLRLTGLIINGARKQATPQIRQYSAGASAFVWAGMSYCFWQSGDPGINLGLFPCFLVFELDNIKQAARDQEQVKRYGRDT